MIYKNVNWEFINSIINQPKSYQAQYAAILEKLMLAPRKKTPSRIGDMHSNFAEQIRVDLTKEFPLMDIKSLKFSNILHELLWFIKGDTNIKYLIENDCHIWTDDAYRYYKEKYSPFRMDRKMGQYSLGMEISKEGFVEKVLAQEKIYHLDGTYTYGDLDRVYGLQWRKFNDQTDQLQNCISTLKTNPTDRRMIVTAHNPTDLEDGVVGLPSCHNYFQFYTEPISDEQRLEMAKTIYGDLNVNELDKCGIPKFYLNVFVNIRSNDWFLGQPYNMPSYALLVMMVGRVVNMIPKEIAMNAVDAHLYAAHFEAAQKWLDRYYQILEDNHIGETGVELTPSDVTFCKSGIRFTRSAPRSIDEFKFDDFELRDYNPQKYIFAPLLT